MTFPERPVARPPAVRACVGCDALAAPSRVQGRSSIGHSPHSFRFSWGCTVPPSVVLVTGVSKFLGGYLAARLAADPDHRPRPRRRHRAAAARPAAPHGPRRVRARRHPQPADRQGHLAGVGRHRRPRLARRQPRLVGRAHGDEGDERHRHDAAARRLPEGAERAAGRAEVHHRRLRLQLARPGPVRRGDDAEGLPVGRLRQGRRRDRGVPARVRPPPPRRLGHRAALRQLHRPAHRHRLHPLLRAAGRAHRAGLRRPRAAAARGGRARRAGARGEPRAARHVQRRRRRRADALAGHPPCGPDRDPGARARGRPGQPDRPRRPPGRLLARADAPAQLRARRGHHPAAHPVRIHPALDHHAGLRRLRARPRAPPGDLARTGSSRWSAACSPP